MGKHRFPYCWKKTDLDLVQKHGHKVFSTFACGGGSSFGYKMAGFDVIGFNEIDKEMVSLYLANHHPIYKFHEPIQTFKHREDLPDELFDLDILDGSPPCSTFSMAGSREEAWGKEKKFREGQAEQVLSDLFFDYLDVVKKLMPKVSVAENVKGMLIGKARGYCDLIRRRYDEIGYDVQLFLMNSASLGVPQARERVFFIARRKDLGLKPLVIDFHEDPVPFREVCENLPFQDLEGTDAGGMVKAFWHKTKPGKGFEDAANGNFFNCKRLSMDVPALTLTSSVQHTHPTERRWISWIEACLCGSYPYDYDFLGKNRAMKLYCIGMSVPPVMTAQIAAQIAEQWFKVDSEVINSGWVKP
jgi:DNA (cytosine-5)-methyltransferase 1